MLVLKGITKDYQTGDTKVEALRGVDLRFRKCEFAAILGPSGCGKTTLLNIIGGLDQYTQGDLIINGQTTVNNGFNIWYLMGIVILAVLICAVASYHKSRHKNHIFLRRVCKDSDEKSREDREIDG